MFHLSKYFYTLLCHCFCKKKKFWFNAEDQFFS